MGRKPKRLPHIRRADREVVGVHGGLIERFTTCEEKAPKRP